MQGLGSRPINDFNGRNKNTACLLADQYQATTAAEVLQNRTSSFSHSFLFIAFLDKGTFTLYALTSNTHFLMFRIVTVLSPLQLVGEGNKPVCIE
jgi:hypothetical protein